MKTTTVEEAVARIHDGASLMIGGFMGVGTPELIVDELVRQGKRNLTVIANDNAMPGVGIGKLVDAGLVSHTIASHIGLNPETQKRMLAGSMKVELIPQGTLVERIRAGGCGLGGVLTATGLGTVVEECKRVIEVDGKRYLLETALRADFALLNAFPRRLPRQPFLRSHRAQLQSRDGARRRHGHRAGGERGAGGNDLAGPRDHARASASTI